MKSGVSVKMEDPAGEEEREEEGMGGREERRLEYFGDAVADRYVSGWLTFSEL